MNELFSVKDQVVVITGGTGVLGRCIGEYLATQGAKVVILGRRQEEGDEIVSAIAAKGGEAMFLVTDVMNPEVVQANCDAVMAKYGRVDALLNAAGGNMAGAVIAPEGNIFDVKIDAFQKVLDLNLTGTVIPTQIFLKPMVDAGKGAIVNFSSMAAFRPITRVMGYAAAKAGISNFTAFL
ncbi:MAG: SDR family NAD(P)-dependent oxidoreductase, partial [Duncaniella sp.]|nr:SDR family NAD(P)-dependent oxidoreductase [Duncaniella sp.]